jgi:hypothetical protein
MLVVRDLSQERRLKLRGTFLKQLRGILKNGTLMQVKDQVKIMSIMSLLKILA